jgi:hypothetical protein
MALVVFARIGWMKWYRGPQPDDEAPIGGGKYNKSALGHEAFNFFPLNGKMLGYFQPRLIPGRSSTLALERIKAGFKGDALDNVTVVFVATHPTLGRQRIIGWYLSATVYRKDQPSNAAARNLFTYFGETDAKNAFLVPESRRIHEIPGGGGGFGQANVCYPLEINGQPKNAQWMADALDYVHSYALENIAQEPESGADQDIEEQVSIAIEHGAGFQSNPKIRRAIELYAMNRAKTHLLKLGYAPKDKSKTESFDFLCTVNGSELYVEVKGMQDNGQSVSLTPKEVDHARDHANSALFIVHSVKVEGKRKPVVSGGKEIFIHPWSIADGILKPRGFVFTLCEAQRRHA